MGSINIDKYILINNKTLLPSSSGFSLGGLYLTLNSYIPTSTRVLEFFDTESVGDYFGLLSSEYAQSVIYFASNINAGKIPVSIKFARFFEEATNGQILGKRNNSTTLTQFKAITTGTINVTINGTAHSITAIDLSATTSLSSVASAIATAINAVVAGSVICTYDTILAGFILTDILTLGSTSIISVANGTAGSLTNLLGLGLSDGAVQSNGVDAETIVECMDAIVDINRNFATINDLLGLNQDDVLSLVEWVTTNKTQYVYNVYSLDTNILVAGNTTNIFYLIDQANSSGINKIYGNIDTSSFFAGICAGTNYDATAGTISFAYKQGNGLMPTVTSTAVADILESTYINYIGKFASRANNYNFTYGGWVTGSYKTLANIYNNMWLADQLQTALVNLMLQNNKIIYTTSGYAKIGASIQNVIIAALNNGTIAIGTVLDATQTIEINTEAGVNCASSITNNGYYYQVVPATPEQRINQTAPLLNFWYANGGEIIKITVNNTLVE